MPMTRKSFVSVAHRATNGSNQSERSTFFSTNQNRAYGSCDPNDVSMTIFGHKNSRDPMGKRTRSHKSLNPCVWSGYACAVLPKAWTLRSHVSGIVGTCEDHQNTPQVPRIHMSLFPHRPTARAPTLKLARPLASPKVIEKHTVWRTKSLQWF